MRSVYHLGSVLGHADNARKAQTYGLSMQVLDSLLIAKLPGATQPLDLRIAGDKKYFPHF
jgi:hypothetical protein